MTIQLSNSVTVDPHKLGYVPYASGAFITRVPREYYVTPFEAPYLRFDQSNYVGTQTLEGSRSAGGAVAMWLTAKSMGLDENGYGYILEKTIKQQRKLEKALSKADTKIKIAPNAETNIVSFSVLPLIKSHSQRLMKELETFMQSFRMKAARFCFDHYFKESFL